MKRKVGEISSAIDANLQKQHKTETTIPEISLNQKINRAAEDGNVVLTKELLLQLSCKYEIDEQIVVCLAIAAKHGHINLIKHFETQGISVNVKLLSESTLLHYAVIYNRSNMSEYLISQGAKVNIEDENGRTPLYWAVKNGYIELVKYLIEKGANVNELIDNNNQTPFQLALSKDNIKIIEYYLEQGGIDNYPEENNKYIDLCRGTELADIIYYQKPITGQIENPISVEMLCSRLKHHLIKGVLGNINIFNYKESINKYLKNLPQNILSGIEDMLDGLEKDLMIFEEEVIAHVTGKEESMAPFISKINFSSTNISAKYLS